MKTLLNIKDVGDELNLSSLEVKRAIAKGQFMGAQDIIGDAGKLPDWRFTPKDLAKYASIAAEVRLPPNFLDQRGGLSSSLQAYQRLRNHWTSWVRDNVADSDWERGLRRQLAGDRRLNAAQRINSVSLNLQIPSSILEYSRGPAIGGIAGRIGATDEGGGFSLGQAVLFNMARKVMKSILSNDQEVKALQKMSRMPLDVLYSRPSTFSRLTDEVLNRVREESISSGRIEVTLNLPDLSPTSISFIGSATFQASSLFDSQTFRTSTPGELNTPDFGVTPNMTRSQALQFSSRKFGKTAGSTSCSTLAAAIRNAF